jgi:hypothetical protein
MNNQTVPDDVIEKAKALVMEAYDFGQFSDDFDQPLAKPVRKAVRIIADQLQRQREAVAQHEAIGEIVTTVIGDNEVCMIEWKGKYKPKKGDHIYAAPPLPQDARELLEKVRVLVDEAERAADHLGLPSLDKAAAAVSALIPTEKEPS